jgi:hypothetical protein
MGEFLDRILKTIVRETAEFDLLLKTEFSGYEGNYFILNIYSACIINFKNSIL